MGCFFMILNVSGRTDIVAFYSKWFMNRYREGFVDVRNPFNPKLVSRIYFKDVDAILFCTKNPLPILNDLKKIKEPVLFHVTLTPYKKNIEPNVIDKGLIIEGIKKLSGMIGVDRVYVRYDPIFLSDEYDLDYHKKAFQKMCMLLSGYVKRIIVSFLDDYKNVRRNRNIIKYREFTKDDYREIGTFFSKVAGDMGMTVQTCYEENNLVEYGFIKGECLSHTLAYQLTGKSYPEWKARRDGSCHCVEMVDIGAYNSCNHLCRYCYANFNEKQIKFNVLCHNPTSSLLIGELNDDDVIKERFK